MAGIVIGNVQARSGDVQALRGVLLPLAGGEFLALPGPSGRGRAAPAAALADEPRRLPPHRS